MARTTSLLPDEINSPAKLLHALQQHDWTYAMSDDHRYWVSGQNSWKRIQDAADRVPNGKRILSHYVKIINLINYGHE